MKIEQEILKKLKITSVSYITYWIDNNGEMRKTCMLATCEESAMAQTKYIYKDFVKGLKSELGTLPFSSS